MRISEKIGSLLGYVLSVRNRKDNPNRLRIEWSAIHRGISCYPHLFNRTAGSRFSSSLCGWKQAHGADNLDGGGMCEVRIGGNVFTCLRVPQLEGLVTEEDTPIDVAYITPEDRTVLIRDYAHDCFDDIDRSHALVIDEQTLYHWTDRVTGAGMGL